MVLHIGVSYKTGPQAKKKHRKFLMHIIFLKMMILRKIILLKPI